MAIKIIIERKIKAGKDTEYAGLMREMRAKAMLAKGYISGETLRAHDDPNLYVVISTWKSLDDWNAWTSSTVRNELVDKMNAILEQPTVIRVFDFS
jgi:heme-degrading monooxygenase HmoA